MSLASDVEKKFNITIISGVGEKSVLRIEGGLILLEDFFKTVGSVLAADPKTNPVVPWFFLSEFARDNKTPIAVPLMFDW